MATIEISGVTHFYDLTAPVVPQSKPVLVFIHGWLLSRSYWQPLISSLSSQYQCLSYDLRGFGDSSSLSPDNDVQNDCSRYTLAAYAEDLALLLQKLNIDQAWLIGHSLGGSIALWGADLYPQQIQGVICLNSGGGIYLKEEFERFRAAGQQLVKNRPRWLAYFSLIDWVFTRLMVSRPLSLDWGHQRVRDFLIANEEAALGSLLDSTTETEVHLLPQVVARLRQPVYFMAGSKDTVMETKYVRHLASFHHLFNENSENVLEIPDCGHFSMLEQTEIVLAQIDDILTKEVIMMAISGI